MESDVTMKFDDILHDIGEFGRYQRRQYLMLGMVIFSCGVQIMMTVFTMATPRHRCAVPGLTNDSYTPRDVTHAQWVTRHIPGGGDGEGCVRYVTGDDVMSSDDVTISDDVATEGFTLGFRNITNATTPCDRWVFDDSDFTQTIVTQLQLVCDRKLVKSHVMMALMVGQTLGCLVQGPVADIMGRKAVLMTSLVIHLAASVMTSFAYDVYLFYGVFFVNGLVMAGAYISCYTIGMEFIGPRYRHRLGVAITAFWSLGMLWACLLAVLLPDWRRLQLAASGPIVGFISYFFLVPESARWLTYKGRHSQADVIIQRAARVNRVNLNSGVNHSSLTPVRSHRREEVGREVKPRLVSLVKYPRLVLRCLVVAFIWFVCSLTYYGLGLNVGQLSGSVFINFTLSALCELLAYAVVVSVLARWGNRTIFCAALLLGALACLATIVPVIYSWPRWVVRGLSMAGKLGMSGAFAMAWMFTSELFPTSLRASVVGVSSCSARVGGVAAAYIANLTYPGGLGAIMPQIVFGAVGLVAGLLALLLPETREREMPETVSEAAVMSRKASTDKVTGRSNVLKTLLQSQQL